MLNAVIPAPRLQDTIEAIRAIIDECRLKIALDGFSIKAVDPANAAMVSLELTIDAFESYEATEGTLGLDVDKMRSILELAGKKDRIELRLDEEKHKLIIKIGGLSYTMALLDPNSVRVGPRVPILDLPARVKIPGAGLKSAIKGVEKVDDYAYFKFNGAFVIETDTGCDNVEANFNGKVEVIQGGPAKSLFPVDYLTDFMKAAGKAEKVELEIGIDLPIKMDFMIAEGYGNCQYMLAPRVGA